MKALIIASDIGLTAPGIVYETIISELENKFDISVIVTQTNVNYKNLSITILPSVNNVLVNNRVEKYSISLFGRNILDDIWVYKQKKLIDNDVVKNQDVIISFASFHNYRGILLGHYLSKKFKKKWVVYSVDAIPAPIGWVHDGSFYRNTRKFIGKYLSQCDGLFSANEQMLKYQINTLSKKHNIYTGVLYTPIRNIIIDEIESESNTPIFLYTGGIYGPRKVNALLDGFRLFLEKCPNAKMLFVGRGMKVIYDTCFDLISSGNIEIHDYCEDLNKFYKRATVLLDINAWFDNDVFLSSKIINYLPLKKPILSITGYNSPSRLIFTNDSSILHALHNPEEICLSMIKASNIKNLDMDSRRRYIDIFKAESALQDFINVLDKLTKI